MLILGEKDNIKRIYINFCNPWPKGKHRKKRLTHTRQLEKYKTFLEDGGEIYFKTDDDELFEGSLGYFEEAGFIILKKTNELHLEPIWEDNVILTRFDIERIMLILGDQDNIKRIYINFCNPWPKGKHRKKRLTHTRQLEKYKTFLAEGGEIYFKTDDDELFEGSLGYFEESGFTIVKKTYDLHAQPIWENNIETEHEKLFSEQGIKIKALIAKV